MNNGIQPGAEFGIAPEIRQAAIGFDKYVLCYLFGILPRRGIAQADGENEILVSFHQHGIGLLLALQHPADDGIIVWTGLHALAI